MLQIANTAEEVYLPYGKDVITTGLLINSVSLNLDFLDTRVCVTRVFFAI